MSDTWTGRSKRSKPGKELIKESPVWQVEEDLLRLTPGVGEETTARTLLGRLPELGNANRREIAKLVGIVPIAQESGTWEGERPHLKSAGTLHSMVYTVGAIWTRNRIPAKVPKPPLKTSHERQKSPPSTAERGLCEA